MNLIELKKKWLHQMATIRFFEENLASIYSSQIVRCPVHLAIGHEASAVGVCTNLNRDDRILSYHRCHHHFLAKGGSPKSLLYELLGNEKGCSGGNGGSTHLYDFANGFLGSSAIISGILPVGTGAAHALKLKKKNAIVVCFCGDASIEEGVFFESLNIATLWKLPLLIVIEDNDLSCYTDKKTRQAFRDFPSIAKLFDIPFLSADGSNINDVFSKSNSLIEKIKLNSCPAILHVNVFRAHEHCGPDRDDHLTYRTMDKVWLENDPLEKLKKSIGDDISGEIIKSADYEMKNLYQNILEELGFAINV